MAVGNCVSLQREKDAALRCFQRALQLDPNYAYAYTVHLVGRPNTRTGLLAERALTVSRLRRAGSVAPAVSHAVAAFRPRVLCRRGFRQGPRVFPQRPPRRQAALQRSVRDGKPAGSRRALGRLTRPHVFFSRSRRRSHRSSRYWLGTIYFRQEKYESAQYHYRQAIEINPGSALLYCHYAMALVRRGARLRWRRDPLEDLIEDQHPTRTMATVAGAAGARRRIGTTPTTSLWPSRRSTRPR